MHLYVFVLYLCAVKLFADGRSFSPAGLLQGATRRLQQEDVATGVRVADLSKLPSNVTALVEYAVPETQLKGSINISYTDSKQVSYGSYYLGPDQVRQLNATISAEMPLVPPSDTNSTPVIDFPGVALRGESVLDTLSTKQPKRIPTVYSPFHAGWKFIVAGKEVPPGVTLNFSNMTLLLANVTYEGIYSSGFMDFFNLGRSARFCFTNSMLVLRSCKGYVPDTYHMWCCTKRQCNILYTQQAIEDLGYDTIDDLEYITCHALEPSEDGTPTDGGAGTGVSRDVTIPLAASSVALVTLLSLALFVLWRHRRFQRLNRHKEEEMQMQIGNYEQELEHHRERSKNEQAELQKVKMQYKMLEMDLLANTAGSGDKPPSGVADPPSRNPPQPLTVLDADETQQNAKSIQRQLRSVLHAADERTPVSVQAEIGRGAFGVVYRGVWKNIQVAIKTVLFQASGDIQSDPVLREAMLALRIAHPNLVATYRANVRMLEDVSVPTGTAASGGGGGALQFTGEFTPSYQLFLLQEYCDSGTLYDWLSRERMHPGNVPDQAVIVRCALDIARGVQHLHHSEIIHGDLKPQNIMLTTVPEAVRTQSDTPSPPSFPYIAKLTDFGLSFQMDRNKSHMSNMRIGTPFYFAPEVQGKGYLSKASDMYSFGVLLWEMFHGMPPYAADNGHLVNNNSFPRFDLRHREDAPFSYVVVSLACLSDNYEKRPNIDDVVTVLEDLNECLNGTPDGSQLMRNASLRRVTKGSYKAGFAAPASLVKQVNAAPPLVQRANVTRTGKSVKTDVNVSQTILGMLSRSGLHRDTDLRKRLDVTDAAELEKLAGATGPHAGGGRAPERCLKDVHGKHGAASVHVNQQWMFDVLPPSSFADGTGRPGVGATGTSRKT
eukprot:jgi/Ulvmu1/6358/UM029_0066.1